MPACLLPPCVLPLCLAAVATVLHAVNAVAEIMYRSKKSGEAITMRPETKLQLAEIAKIARPNDDISSDSTASSLILGDPSAFYDCKEERWVLVFASYPNTGEQTASLFVAVSHTIHPMEDWTVYALEARPQVAPGYRFASAGGSTFRPYGAQVGSHACRKEAVELALPYLQFLTGTQARDTPRCCPPAQNKALGVPCLTLFVPPCPTALPVARAPACLPPSPAVLLLRRWPVHQHRRLLHHRQRRGRQRCHHVNPVRLLQGRPVRHRQPPNQGLGSHLPGRRVMEELHRIQGAGTHQGGLQVGGWAEQHAVRLSSRSVLWFAVAAGAAVVAAGAGAWSARGCAGVGVGAHRRRTASQHCCNCGGAGVCAAAACRTFNNLITPARPQDPEDVDAAPLFVMKVGCT